jgi:hypothetical protein
MMMLIGMFHDAHLYAEKFLNQRISSLILFQNFQYFCELNLFRTRHQDSILTLNTVNRILRTAKSQN